MRPKDLGAEGEGKQKMKVVRNKVIPFGKEYGAINLFGVLFAKLDFALTPTNMNHEQIHSRQMCELLYLPFYILYIIEWICRLFQNKFDTYRAYRAISFEKEAYCHQHDLNYLSRRQRFAQWRDRPHKREETF